MTKNEFNMIVNTAFKHNISIEDACEKLGYSYEIISNRYPKQLTLAIASWLKTNFMVMGIL